MKYVIIGIGALVLAIFLVILRRAKRIKNRKEKHILSDKLEQPYRGVYSEGSVEKHLGNYIKQTEEMLKSLKNQLKEGRAEKVLAFHENKLVKKQLKEVEEYVLTIEQEYDMMLGSTLDNTGELAAEWGNQRDSIDEFEKSVMENEKIETMNQMLQRLRVYNNELASFRDWIEEKSIRLALKNKEVDTLREAIQNKNNEIKALKKDVHYTDQAANEVHSRLIDYEEQIEKLKKSAGSKGLEYAVLDKNKRQFQGVLRKLKQEKDSFLSIKSKATQTYRGRIKLIQTNVKDKNDAIDTLNQKIEFMKEARQFYEVDLQILQERIRKSEKNRYQFEYLSRKRKAYRHKVNLVKNFVNVVTEQIRDKNECIEAYRFKSQKEKSLINELIEENTALKLDNTLMQEEIEELKHLKSVQDKERLTQEENQANKGSEEYSA